MRNWISQHWEMHSTLLWMLLFSFLGCGGAAIQVTAAEIPVEERRAFEAARIALDDGLYDFAEKSFSEFLTLFPSSPLTAEVRLKLSEARFHLKKFSEVRALLARFLGEAGGLADQYQFWIAESLYSEGMLEEAGTAYAELLANHPDSELHLAAAFRQAYIFYREKNYQAAIELLGKENGAFESARRRQPGAANSILGLLMLADSRFELGSSEDAERTLAKIPEDGLNATQGWRRLNLLVRLRLAAADFAGADELTVPLLSLAKEIGDMEIVAESNSLNGSVLEGLGRPKEAVEAYKLNLDPKTSAAWRREALVKIVELSLLSGSTDEVVSRLELLSANELDTPARDLVQLTLGELRLQQFYGVPFDQRIPGGTYSPTASNALALAQVHFDRVITEFTNSSYRGRAWINKAWCDWQLQRWASAQESFSNAFRSLPEGLDQAVSVFKLGDAQFMQGQFTNALANYNRVISEYGGNEVIKNQLLDQAYYQVIQAGIAANDLESAEPAMRALIRQFPGSFYADRSLLLVGQALNQVRDPAAARDVFEEFRSGFTGSSLEPEVQLAIARTHELEGNWDAAANVYSGWLTNNTPGWQTNLTQHASIPNAAFGYAWAEFQAGNLESAHSGFTNFVALFPTNELASVALQWLGDDSYSKADFSNAELYYQKLFISTNWPASTLTFNAQMLAGRSALGRQDYAEAKRYLTNLINHPKCPDEVYAGALFAYGDVLISEPSEDPAKFANARGAFDRIISARPGSSEVPAAWGRVGDCNFQLGLYADATNAFRTCMTHGSANISQRSQAEVKLGKCLEKMAEENEAKRGEILKTAMGHYLNVFLQQNISEAKGESADSFWVQRAGLNAAALAEAGGNYEQAGQLYRRLKEMLPQMRAYLDQRIQQQERLAGRGGG